MHSFIPAIRSSSSPVKRLPSWWLRSSLSIVGMLMWVLLTGCGTTREQMATDQLILSDAVDQSISHIDFSPLADEKVFLDTKYVPKKASSHINSEYIISSMRQQMVLAGLLLQDTADDADYIVEPRIGAIGRDGHDVNFGIPGNNTLNTAASLVTSTPPLPTLPEVSLARRTVDAAAAKIAVFAYHRESKRAVWQSGLSIAKSSAKNRWLLGAGPFQSGEIYGSGTMFAGGNLKPKGLLSKRKKELREDEQAYRDSAVIDPSLQKKLYDRLELEERQDQEMLANSSEPNLEEKSDESEKTAAESGSDVEPKPESAVGKVKFASNSEPDASNPKPATKPKDSGI